MKKTLQQVKNVVTPQKRQGGSLFQRIRIAMSGSYQEIIIGGQLACIVVCALMIGHLAQEAVAVSSSYGNRELPIYSVGIEEKKGQGCFVVIRNPRVGRGVP